MLSRCFHFRVFEIFVSSLFLGHVSPLKPSCVSGTYEELAGFQEENHDAVGACSGWQQAVLLHPAQGWDP